MDITNLLAGSVDNEVLSPESSGLLGGFMGPVVIAGASGTDSDDIEVTSVTLITVILDASSSIRFGGLEGSIRDGFNGLVNALRDSKEADSILFATWIFNNQSSVLHSYVPVKDAVLLTTKNYQGRGSTALYRTWAEAVAAHVSYAKTLRDSGTPTRSVLVVLTDGFDTEEMVSEQECTRINHDLLKSEQYVLAFVGVGDETDFRQIAKRMGFPDGCILVQTGTTPSDIRKTFEMVSKSTLKVSQGTIQPGQNAGFFI